MPTKKEDLQSAGYMFDNEARCRGCRQAIEWWITPKGAKMPMSVIEVREGNSNLFPITEIQRRPHWANCPNAAEFRRR